MGSESVTMKVTTPPSGSNGLGELHGISVGSVHSGRSARMCWVGESMVRRRRPRPGGTKRYTSLRALPG